MIKFLDDVRSSFKKLFDRDFYISIFTQFKGFFSFLSIYLKDKIFFVSGHFEGSKGSLVRNVLIKRGKRNRIFLHVSAMAVLTVGVVVSPFISDTNIFGANKNLSFAQGGGDASLTTPDVFNTQASEKPRDKVITYNVQNGDTISTIAKKFGISTDTIKWENDLTDDSITTGDTLRILPVTGVSHKVAAGDTIYTIAKKYKANAQAIVDFPFNDFANPQTFSLIEGEILIVPDGVPPAAAPVYVKQTYIATGPVTITGGGFTWPIHGTINQTFSWYHKAVDLGAPIGTPVAAATNGVVSQVFTSGWNDGYGIHVLIAGSNGYTTLYAHMMAVNVSVGQTVEAGKSIVGWVGLTGRTTGPHLHFEVRSGGNFYDPLSVLN
ncbi:MAG TPA: peptidoglycan DD-metalloendopeptidase family protein [Patescibacteria group bacterium]|nr:peptidoglycan DD-metalloendopeptidase family protein [Patescibacteria group bacterium]